MPLLEQVKILALGDESNDDQRPAGSVAKSYLNTILNSMRVSVVACSNPTEACDLAMSTILAAQAHLQAYAQFPAVRLMLIATLFDMLHVYCRLLCLQCRYADMGASIVQMTTLFEVYRADLERTILYRFFLARCHTLIAKVRGISWISTPTLLSMLAFQLTHYESVAFSISFYYVVCRSNRESERYLRSFELRGRQSASCSHC